MSDDPFPPNFDPSLGMSPGPPEEVEGRAYVGGTAWPLPDPAALRGRPQQPPQHQGLLPELGELEQGAEMTVQLLQELGERLEPVLTPEHPTPEGPAPSGQMLNAAAPVSNVTARIRELQRRNMYMQMKINQLLSRLAL